MQDFLDKLIVKLAHVPPPLPSSADFALSQLLAAKAESDKRRYAGKHAILRQLIVAEPHNFEIDSEANGIVGLTHIGNGFKIHMPRTALPPVRLKRRMPPAAVTAAA